MSKQAQKTTCDKCGKVFDVKPREKAHSYDVRETYIECPRCHEHYICYVTDSTIRRLMELQRKEFTRERRDKIDSLMQALKAKIADGLKMEGSI